VAPPRALASLMAFTSASNQQHKLESANRRGAARQWKWDRGRRRELTRVVVSIEVGMPFTIQQLCTFTSAPSKR
jgi:hypothetical protein